MGKTYTMDQAGIVGEITARVGRLSDDEVALVRTLSPAEQPETAKPEHRLDLVDLLTTIREDEAMAEYVYAIAPGWDGTIETLHPRGAGHHGLHPQRARDLWRDCACSFGCGYRCGNDRTACAGSLERTGAHARTSGLTHRATG